MFHKSVAQRLNTLKSFIHLVPCVRSIRGTLYDNAHFMSTALGAQCFSLYTCVQRGFLCAAREDLMCTLRHSCMTVVRRGLIGDIRCKMIKEREPELHHSVLVRSGNSRYFSPWRAAQSTSTPTPPPPPSPPGALVHPNYGSTWWRLTCEAEPSGGQWLYRGLLD